MSAESRHREKLRCIGERTLLTNLECSLLAFISTKADVVLSRPKKVGQFSHEFLSVFTITFLEENTPFTFEVPSFLKRKKTEKLVELNKEGKKGKKGFRQVQNQKKREVIHLLEDILFEDGFLVFYDNENREGIRGNVIIQMPNGQIIQKEMIIKLGEAIWTYCSNKFNEEQRSVLIKEKVTFSKEKVMSIISENVK
ncbi:hypothetical protein EIN_148450 [Entamoeba invadens IP1]|uniref:Uncharacterized protein n=1 Tax=Entamoeba invadens IP1 TaxID=370355 RepID=L7FKV9_ENTIV|nr:hypothetical protein EIN_148450 [Entamoeba invadens IP1]ELP85533.1 hypothetical protein EIN_148450 [Entamoeba invadens IP1]|eukprot:XP_004184879.1 hypothetical protein EIN_148450 [Entamoeba invadens IP1]